MSGHRIAIVQGADPVAIQRCMGDFVARHRARLRIVGVLEVFDEAAGEPGCKASRLRSIADGGEFDLFQDLGPGATSCSLLPEGVIASAEAVRAQIDPGCDLVVLSKFGKLEAENGSGLIPAFVAALEAGVPILTSVSPRFGEAWARFADPLFVTLECDGEALEDWWQGLRATPAAR